VKKPIGGPKANAPRKPRRGGAVPDDKAKQDAALDEALEETFPASDPIAPYRHHHDHSLK
jgi:hypothetical protein